MGADLNNVVKCQVLSDEHVQFLVYQLLRGLKVGARGRAGGRAATLSGRDPDLRLPLQYIHSAGIIHRVGAGVRLGLRRAACAAPLCPPSPPDPDPDPIPTLQDLKPSNVAVNEDCELRVSAGAGGAGHGGGAPGAADRPGSGSRSWTSGWPARRRRR